MRIVVDNRSIEGMALKSTLALFSEADAGAMHPLIVAFADERLPASLLGWRPPQHTLPEIHGDWLALPATTDMLANGNYPAWCLNGSPGSRLDPALRKTLRFTVASAKAEMRSDGPAISGKASVRMGVLTHAEADILFAQGTDWVAGWPLPVTKPDIKGRGTEKRMIVVRLLQLVQANADIDELEALLKQDAGLAFKLLRYINSASNGLTLQIQSFQHAVMILGYKRLTRWLALLVLASGENPDLLPVMGISLRRAFFTERVGKLLFGDVDPDELFMTGMFSLLDVIFSQPFDVLLEKLSLPEAVSDSLRNHSEPYGPLLHLAQTIERDDPEAIRQSIEMLGLNVADVNRALMLAIRDADLVELG